MKPIVNTLNRNGLKSLNEFEIRFSGSGGQGLQLLARIATTALVDKGFKVSFSQSYEPTSRGGLSRSDLVVGADTIDYPLPTALDFLLIMHEVAANHSTNIIKEGGLVLLDREQVSTPPQGPFVTYSFSLTETARRIGNIRVANIIGLGALAGLGGFCEPQALEQATRKHAPESFLDLNLEALHAGFQLANSVNKDDYPTKEIA